ncbi:MULTISPECIES: CCA tRNA nucleotidyltransferase [Bhargavaea]|uniref:CCA tRNA nucleotidyltransferase n=1 Tax=Bhargavaea changchunensis TaxID=2134037 RepID=A0ABW2NE64_9BACL|nr:CCA tRNA nucleotidyltransferase [Bhargavaea sp. CC-171006]
MTDKHWQSAFEIVGRLREAGHEAVIVGGAVRDRLMGLPAHDVDVATAALPQEVKTIFPKTADVGIAHGTVMVLDPSPPVEVTTYRTEGIYTDHRRPDHVEYVTSLREDLRRRDFTMNAIAIRGDGSLYDPFGGEEDIRRGIIRAVGDPDERFGEDALRMLRAVRFAARTGFEIEPGTKAAISRQAASIHHVSVERIKVEMDKVWASGRAGLAAQLMAETGLAEHLPLMERAFSATNLGIWQKFGKPAETVEGWALLYLLAGFPEGNPYKLSNAEKRSVGDILKSCKIRSERPYNPMDAYRLPEHALITGAKFAHLTGKSGDPEDPGKIRSLKNGLPISSLRDLAITGNDLIGWSGKKGGPWVKEWLSNIEEAVVTGHLKNTREDIKGWFLDGIESKR